MAKHGFQKIGDIVNQKRGVKPPAYEWQELALKIINELGIPNSKKSSVFKVCRDHPKPVIEQCLNDTKELAEKDRWKYFFKLIGQR